MRHGGQILADQLKILGVRRVFSVPGESFLAALDGLYDSGIDNIVCRHEGGAAMMAEAYGKLTNTPGVAFVTRGPGATNASSGIHIARQDSTPMVMFVGQIARGHRDREAFQEVDYRAMFAPLAKWVAEVEDTARLPEYISRAFSVAISGRPGPVVLALPEDMLSAEADVPDLIPSTSALPDLTGPAQTILSRLKTAKNPLIVVGGPLWTASASAALAQFAETAALPVVTTFRRQDYLDNRHPNFCGDLNVGLNPTLAKRLQAADCILALGTRLGDIATQGYTLLDPAGHGKTLIHVHADADELGRVYAPTLAVNAPAPAMIAALAASNAKQIAPDLTQQMRAEYQTWNTPKATPGNVKMEQVIAHLSDALPDDAILTNGAGNYAAFLHRYFRYKTYPTQLAPTSGSMGYGVPAAVSAALEHPDRDVICLAGDGCFQMTLNELSTAAQHNAKVIFIICNNGQYGTIRMHQEKTYPARVSGTKLFNPDYAALAKSYGGTGLTVSKTADFPAALDTARASKSLAVIELCLDPEALSTGATLTQTRAAATNS
ncbi:thiamine pyrophosphate-binding protein [Cognatishimia sp. MH4019]|uniref:thiamine pyrophosphate-binding protein n=1 Tax=Cognatishimia sp. MH4019 TaxID=2854030 RepID=UPI001CD7D55F|nr:thiamine pyrophosphate-binding protein [Cognatishimia sp. MH4019]